MLTRHHAVARHFFSAAAAAALLGAISSAAYAGITFNFTRGSGLVAGSAADLGFQQAAARWSSLFGNTFTMNLTIDYRSFGGSSSILGQAGSSQVNYSYSNVRTALVTGATSVNDAAAIASLPTGNSISLLTNYTSDNPNGAASLTNYVDNGTTGNNSNIQMTTANAKALGLLGATNTVNDASITFNSDFAFDFDPSDGITGNRTDFVGVATHEIGHALGFISGVDDLDTSGGTSAADSFRVTTMDLFRYSSASTAAGVRDFSAGTSDKYFSLNNGATKIASFATGQVRGDGRQASHWKDNLGIGIMDPTASPNELLSISATDRQLFDVIGYRIVGADVPEPSSLALLGVGGVPLGIWYRRKRCAA